MHGTEKTEALLLLFSQFVITFLIHPYIFKTVRDENITDRFRLLPSTLPAVFPVPFCRRNMLRHSRITVLFFSLNCEYQKKHIISAMHYPCIACDFNKVHRDKKGEA
jgi:hypothetical protein